MTISDLCQRARKLCEQIAKRDLAGTPLYIVAQSTLPGIYGDASATYGCWSPSNDLYYREAIGADWRGRGACVLINDVMLREDFGDDDLELHFLAITLHEFAHALQSGIWYRERTDVAPDLLADRMKFESFALALQLDEPPTPSEAQAAFFAHGGPFIRVCLHLAFRACVAGERIGPALLCGGRRYPCSLFHPSSPQESRIAGQKGRGRPAAVDVASFFGRFERRQVQHENRLRKKRKKRKKAHSLCF